MQTAVISEIVTLLTGNQLTVTQVVSGIGNAIGSGLNGDQAASMLVSLAAQNTAAQGAVTAIEDGWVLAEQVGAQRARRSNLTSGVDWPAALAAYEAVRPEHCRRVVTTARKWGELWHHDGIKRLQRNAVLRSRDTYDYAFTDWIYGPTALRPEQEPELYPTIPLDSAQRL